VRGGGRGDWALRLEDSIIAKRRRKEESGAGKRRKKMKAPFLAANGKAGS